MPAKAVLASVIAFGGTPSLTQARSTGPHSQTHHSMSPFQSAGSARDSMEGVRGRPSAAQRTAKTTSVESRKAHTASRGRDASTALTARSGVNLTRET